MKNRFSLFAAILITSVVFSACSKNDDSASDPLKVEQNVQSGTWKVTYYKDSGEVRTNYFNGFNFQFNQNGTVTATNGTVTHNGTLSVYPDSGDTKFELVFQTVSGPFEEISEDWKILLQSATTLELVNISGDNGGTDYLTFEKN
jgi:hypothetical protein